MRCSGPGRGGGDSGAIGPGGAMEKDVCLRFCNILAERLSKSFHAELTRTGDYAVKICDRTAAANRLKRPQARFSPKIGE